MGKKSFLIYILPILLVLITPFIWSDNMYNGLITAKQIWFYTAMALLILVVAIEVLSNKKNLILSFNIIDISLLTFYTYFLIRAAFTPYTPLIYNTRFINLSLLVVLYFIIKRIINSLRSHSREIQSNDARSANDMRSVNDNQMTPLIFLIIIFLIISGLIQAIWGLLQLYGITRSFHTGFKITGTFFNPAPYALYLAAIFPLALGTLLQTKNDVQSANDNRMTFTERMTPKENDYKLLSYYISLMTVISIILVLPATMNRASWLEVVAGALFLFTYRYDLLTKALALLHNTARKLITISFILLVIGLSGIGLYFLKKGSSEGRLLIWEVTLGKIIEKPLFGHGVGRFEAEYNNWQSDYFKSHPSNMDGPDGMAAGNTKYCFNEYLEFGSEIGIVGLFLFLIFLGTIVYYAFRKFKSNGKQFIGYFLYLFSAFISMLVMAIISFPFYSLSTLIVFFFLTAIISSNVTYGVYHEKKKIAFNLSQFHRLLLFQVLVPFSVLLLLYSRQQYKSYYTFDEAVKLYQAGAYREACKSFSEIYRPLQFTGCYMQYYGKALTMNEEYQTGLEMLRLAGHFTSDEVLYTTLGDTYKKLNRYAEAEEAYLHSSFMVPHKLYPLYQLAIFYDETEQKEKAVNMAEVLLNKNIKVESTATEEILQAMKKLIKKLEGFKD